jgi:hypothetical protein
MRIDRSRLNWGVFLIVLGAVPLAYHQGLVAQSTLADAWRLWPLVLVGIGLGLILARTPARFVGGLTVAVILGLVFGSLFAAGPSIGCTSNAGGAQTASGSGAFEGSAEINLDFQCGTATIGASPDAQWHVDATTNGGGQAAITSDSASVRVNSWSENHWQIDRGRDTWSVRLPADVALSLNATTNGGDTTYNVSGVTLASANFSLNAGAMRVDFSGASVGNISFSTNAGATSITLDGNSDVSGSVTTNVGSTKLCTPEGLAIRIRSSDSLGSTSLPGLTRVGDAFQSADWDTATHKADLSVSTSIGSFQLNPSGGCK